MASVSRSLLIANSKLATVLLSFQSGLHGKDADFFCLLKYCLMSSHLIVFTKIKAVCIYTWYTHCTHYIISRGRTEKRDFCSLFTVAQIFVKKKETEFALLSEHRHRPTHSFNSSSLHNLSTLILKLSKCMVHLGRIYSISASCLANASYTPKKPKSCQSLCT